jgi:hypothetical protein
MMVKEPSRGFREYQHSKGKYDGWNYLESPWNSKRGVAVDVGATKLYKILDENAPRDRPLLYRDKATTDGGCSNFSMRYQQKYRK